MIHDLRYAVRMLIKSPGFTVVAVLTLALGIGANAAVFSLVNAVLLKLLPYPDAERLVVINAVDPKGKESSVGPNDFRDWRDQSNAFEHMTYTWYSTGMLTLGGGEPERIVGREVSNDFFQMLDVQPVLGRWFVPQDQHEGHNRVIILSYGMWARRFGARPDILGQALTLGSRTYTVIGVMPQGFLFNDDVLSPISHSTEYWLPMQHWSRGRMVHMYSAYGRLKPGISAETAQAQLSAVAKRLEQAYPDSNTGWGVRVMPMDKLIRAEFGPVMWIFFMAVAAVLLIACANVANLLLARATARTREVAIRAALGARRGSIVRLLLAESVLVSFVAAALGLLLAQWGIDLAIGLAPAGLELQSILRIDRNVLAFTMTLAVLTGVLTGLAPAIAASRTGIGETLKRGGGATGMSAPRTRALNTFVVSEIALAVVLLIASGLLLKSFVRLLGVDLGVRADHIVVVNMGIPRASYPEPQQRVDFYRNLAQRLRTFPGVTSVGASWSVPLSGNYGGGGLEISGRPQPRDWTATRTAYETVTTGYFNTMGIPLLRGRDFTEQDNAGSEPVAIINDVLARKYFPNEDPLGQKIRPDHSQDAWKTIIGIVGDARRNGPASEPVPETYSPHAQSGDGDMFLVVRTAVPPATTIGALRREVRSAEHNATILEIQTMERSVSQSLAASRHLMSAVVFFSLLALLLAAIGLAGVMWYSVSRRTHEIGVRMALGADRGDMLRLILWRGLRLTSLGLILGLAAAFGLTRLLQSLLFGVTPKDPLVFAVVPLLLAAVAVAATYLPARRAANLDPMMALRCE